MGLQLILSVLSSFLKIGVISAYFKVAGYSELDKALLQLCNIKYANRSRFSLIFLQEYLKFQKLYCRSVKLPP